MTDRQPRGLLQSLPVVLVAARMSSKRLPGKSLMRFGSDVLLGHVVSAASAAQGIRGVCVVTSVEASDDPIVSWCRESGVDVWRGSLVDVALRMVQAATELGAEAFVRISGDSPMLDPSIVSAAVGHYADSHVDIVTNVRPRVFPSGQSVEVVRTSTLVRLLDDNEATTYEREHVTPVLYRHEGSVVVGRIAPEDVGGRHLPLPPYPSLAVDTLEDVFRFSAILELLEGRAAWQQGWARCVQLARQADAGAQERIGRQSV